MTESLRVVTVKVGEVPVVESIPNTLEALKGIVEGYLEVVHSPIPDVVIVCNEEGMLEELPRHKLGIHGNFFFVSTDGSEFSNLTDSQVQQIMELLK